MNVLAWIISLALIMFGASGILIVGMAKNLPRHVAEKRNLLAMILTAAGVAINYLLVF